MAAAVVGAASMGAVVSGTAEANSSPSASVGATTGAASEAAVKMEETASASVARTVTEAA